VSGDIVERLRLLGSIDCPYGCDVVGNPAADEIERLRAERDAIDALHQPIGKPAGCCSCWKSWPCKTHRLLHPEGGPS
jgi:hypothetical protein